MSLAAAVLALLLLPVALSQDVAEAVCTVPTLFWTFNSVGSSPCQVASDLAAICNNGFYIIPPLPSSTHYIGPKKQNPCQCNTVFYSLLSACAACQGSGWLNWPQFSENCTQVYTSLFPRPLPVDEKVPGWAYANIELTSKNFSLVLAQGLDQAPESTGVLSATPTPTTLTSSSPSSSTPSASTSSTSNSHAGVIAGSIVGGIVGVVLIACLSLYCCLRRRNSQDRRFSRVPSTIETGTTRRDFSGSFPTAASFNAQKLYDPPDSITFPLPIPGAIPSSWNRPYSPPLSSIGMFSPVTSPTMVVESGRRSSYYAGTTMGSHTEHVPLL